MTKAGEFSDNLQRFLLAEAFEKGVED